MIVGEVNMNFESSSSRDILVGRVSSEESCEVPSNIGGTEEDVSGIRMIINKVAIITIPSPINIGSHTLRSIRNELIGTTTN